MELGVKEGIGKFFDFQVSDLGSHENFTNNISVFEFCHLLGSALRSLPLARRTGIREGEVSKGGKPR